MALPFMQPMARPLPGSPLGAPLASPGPPLGTPPAPPPGGGLLSAIPPALPPIPLPPQPPPPPDPMMDFGGPNPLDDPLMAMLMLLEPVIGPNETPVGPVWPYWYKPSDYPKPSATKMLMLAEADYQAWLPTIRRFEEDYKRTHLKTSARFSRDLRAKDPFISTAMINEVNLAANLIGGIPLVHEVQSGSRDLKDDAQKIEDYLDTCRETFIRNYRDATMGVLPRDEAMSMETYGRCVWRVLINLEDAESPIQKDLLDPATVFPTVDGVRGLSRVTRKYADRLCDVIGLHDPDGTRGSRAKIEQAAQANQVRLGMGIGPDGAAKPIQGLEDHRSVSVVEYWDRRWYGLLVNDVPIKTVAHNYGFVPFVIQLSPLGAPAFTVMGNETRDARGAIRPANYARPLADMGVSRIHYMKHSQNAIEAIHTRGLMEIMKSANPPVVRYQTKEAAIGGLKESSTDEGAVNPAILGEEQIQVWPTAPAPHIFSPVLNQIARDQATGMMPLAAFGVNEQSNVSGHALENLEDAGRDKLAPTVMALELGHAAVSEMILRLIADWGTWSGYEDHKGFIPVYRPNPAPGEDAFYEITPELIRRVGIRVKCSMRHVRMETLGPLFNAGAQGIAIGAMTAEELLEIRGIKDTKRYMRQWEEEKLRRDALDHPEFKKFLILQYLRNSPDPADQELAAKWEQFVMAPPQPPPAPVAGAGGGDPLAALLQGPSTTSGISLPGLGLGPGPGSGPSPALATAPPLSLPAG